MPEPLDIPELTDDEIALMTPDERDRYRELLTRVLAASNWETVARPNQLPPSDAWFVWLILAGRGWGKTRSGAEWTASRARAYPGCRIALVAQRFADGRDVMVEGESGLLSVFAEHELRGGTRESAFNRSLGELYLANSTQLKIYSSEKPRQLRGPSFHFAWVDEVATLYDAHLGPSEDTTWSNLEIACRLPLEDGSDPQIVVTGTPKPVRLLTQRDQEPLGLLHREQVAITRGHTDENLGHLARSYREQVVEPLRGTRLGRQELAAEVLEDVPGALWRRSDLDETRVRAYPYERLIKTVVALDPSDGLAHGAEQGLAVVGVGVDRHIYVLRSEGLRESPLKWLEHAVKVARQHSASIVLERNHGGRYLVELLEQAMSNLGVRVPYQVVNAGDSKQARAEPVAMLWEQRPARVHLVGHHPELEEQLTGFDGTGKSPDRLDALTWGVRALMGYARGGGSSGEPDAAVPWSQRLTPGGAVAWDGQEGGPLFAEPNAGRHVVVTPSPSPPVDPWSSW